MQTYHKIIDDGVVTYGAMRSLASSHVEGVGFLPNQTMGRPNESGSLYVRFAGSGYYRYRSVPRSVYLDLCRAESAGKFLAAHIKGRYEFDKLEGEQIERLICGTYGDDRDWSNTCGTLEEVVHELGQMIAEEVNRGDLEVSEAATIAAGDCIVATCIPRQAGDYITPWMVSNMLDEIGERAYEEVGEDLGSHWAGVLSRRSAFQQRAGGDSEALEAQTKMLEALTDKIAAAVNEWALAANAEPRFFAVSDERSVEVPPEVVERYLDEELRADFRQVVDYIAAGKALDAGEAKGATDEAK